MPRKSMLCIAFMLCLSVFTQPYAQASARATTFAAQTQTQAEPSIALQTFSIPDVLQYTTPFTITSTWQDAAQQSNKDVQVVYQLRSDDVTIVQEFAATLQHSDANGVHTFSTSDTFLINEQVAAGTYLVSVVVRDEVDGHNRAITDMPNMLPDGSYAVGSIDVRQAAVGSIDVRQAAVATDAAPLTEHRIYLPLTDAVAPSIDNVTRRAVNAIEHTYNPDADTYVRKDNSGGNFGDLSHTSILDDDRIITLLRFTVDGTSNEVIDSVVLRLSVMDGAPKADIRVFKITNSWDENSVDWNSRPALGTQVGTLQSGSIDTNAWVEIPLNQAITGNGTYSFAVTTNSLDEVGFRTRITNWLPEIVLQTHTGLSGSTGSTTTATTFTPKQLSMSGPEIVNPFRGLYRWMDQEYAPLPDLSTDAYDRYTWRDLEPSQGNYLFSALENDIANAARQGRKYSFRVRTVVSTKGISIPDYAMGGAGWWEDYDNNGSRDTYVPDWNSSTFLSRLSTFMTALGKRYNGDPRVGFIDIGLYGNWGEWHMASFSYPSSSGAQRATTATKYRLVDMHINAFPSTPLVMLTDDTDALVYAMKRSPTIGWRRDSLGWDTGHFGKIEAETDRWNAIKDRWKTALVVTEFANPRYQSDPEVYDQAIMEVKRYHVSMVSNANTLSWSSLSGTGKSRFQELGKTSGYRLVLNQLAFANNPSPGKSMSIVTRWTNVGVAPVYESWRVRVQFRKVGSSTVAWETTLDTNLTKVLPSSAYDYTDTDVLPSGLARGDYTVAVVIQDPRKTRSPLALAISGVQPDGRYQLGTVKVQ